MNRKYEIEKGTQVGALYKEFFTAGDRKKVRYRGYIFLGVFGGEGFGLEITVYEAPEDQVPFWAKGSRLYRVKSGRRLAGWLVREDRTSANTGKSFHYLRGKINIGGLDVRINAYPEYAPAGQESEGEPVYRLELATPIQCGILRMV